LNRDTAAYVKQLERSTVPAIPNPAQRMREPYPAEF
jgi:hypothetical protein